MKIASYEINHLSKLTKKCGHSGRNKTKNKHSPAPAEAIDSRSNEIRKLGQTSCFPYGHNVLILFVVLSMLHNGSLFGNFNFYLIKYMCISEISLLLFHSLGARYQNRCLIIMVRLCSCSEGDDTLSLCPLLEITRNELCLVVFEQRTTIDMCLNNNNNKYKHFILALRRTIVHILL